MRQVVGGAGTRELERVDGGLYRTVDAFAIRPWGTKLCGVLIFLHSGPTDPSPPAEEAKVMLQGVGARFDFHMCKTLCDLRFVKS